MYEELGLTHIHGPLDLNLKENQAVVLCLVRNGEDFLPDFIQHYRNIGFAHIVFLDNGSNDRTVRMASESPDTTVLRSLASFKKHKLSMKHAMLRMFGRRRWTLIADIDEFFQYPYMDSCGMEAFIGYLNGHGYTSVVTHLLDMTPPCSLPELCGKPFRRISESEWFFNCNAIVKVPYDIRSNRVQNREIMLWKGGMRSSVFDLDTVMLTKHPLNYGDDKMVIHSNHTVGNRNVADVTGVFLHYKFVGDFRKKVQDAVNEGNFYKDSFEYRKYLSKLDQNLQLTSPGSRRYSGHESLLREGLFTITPQYREELGV